MTFTKKHYEQNKDMLFLAKIELRQLRQNPDELTVAHKEKVRTILARVFEDVTSERIKNRTDKAIRQLRNEYKNR